MEEVELHSLTLRYAQSRVRKPKELHRLIHSIERFGQISPVVTVASHQHQLVLIDGYLRVEALRQLGNDTVLAETWSCTEDQALIKTLASCQQRHWDGIEQAALIQQLHGPFKWSLRDIARQIGRDLSWVSRRLALIETLPDEILEAVCQGHISTWAASRVLAPLARANAQHAELLSRSLLSEPLGTRDLAEFYRHYQKSNALKRQRMIQQPALFLKALRSQSEDHSLIEGPEGQWLKDLTRIKGLLCRLRRQLPTAIYPAQDALDRRTLLTAFDQIKALFGALEDDIRRIQHDLSPHQRSHPDPAPQGGEPSPDLSTAEDLQEHRPARGA